MRNHGAKGVESQTQKTVQVCRMAPLPILTFCYKMDRGTRLVSRSSTKFRTTSAIDVTPRAGHIGVGPRLYWLHMDICCDRHGTEEPLPTATKYPQASRSKGLDDPKLPNMCRALLEKSCVRIWKWQCAADAAAGG